jgi:hypothetical protein
LDLLAHMGKKRFDPRYDLNGDGKVNGRDLGIIVRLVGERC